jgi:hypothetical protein
MAVKKLANSDDLKMNVVMKDGREFLGCDVAPKPQGEAERVVAFWNDGAIRMVPLQDVLHVDFYDGSSA